MGPETRLPRGRLVAFSTLAMPVLAAQIPLSVYLPVIYARDLGLSLSTVGAIFLVEKIWGAACDPVIGLMSDRTTSRFGRRRPWIAAGAAVFAASTLYLFFPDPAVTPIHLAIALFLFFLGWSMTQIPFLAWSGELSANYHERTRITGYQAVLGTLAVICLLALPTLLELVRPQDGVAQLNAMGGLLLAMLVPAVFLTLLAFPDPAQTARGGGPSSVARSLRALLSNRLLVRLLAADVLMSIGQGARSALILFFIGAYLGTASWSAALILMQSLFGILAAPLWMKAGIALGKHRAAVAGELIQAFASAGALLLAPGDLAFFVALTALQGLGQGSGNLLLRSMVADVADQSRLQSGEDHAGLFFSAFSISAKMALAVAVGLVLPLLQYLGFDASRADNSAASLHNLALLFAVVPAVTHSAAALFVMRFPLDERRHGEIRRALADRESMSGPSP